jgi:hypothetical protein
VPPTLLARAGEVIEVRRLLRRAGAIFCALFGGFLLLRLVPALAAPDPVGPSAIIAIIAAGTFYLSYLLWADTS